MNAYIRSNWLGAILLTLNALAPLNAAWQVATPGYHYEFPRDHFEHEAFRTEWWYYTGNVTSDKGERFGFELVFFRMGEEQKPEKPSVWGVPNLYLAHAALTNAAGRRFLFHERLNRPGPAVAGASFEAQRIWNGNWSSQWKGDEQTLDAVASDFRFHLTLKPEKRFVIHGEDGVSQKAEGRGRASYYISFPLLAANGAIETGGKSYVVHGRAWMDHEWFTEQLAPEQAGWDWFSVQLDNNTELMLFELRRKDGSIDPWSSGTWIDASGAAHHLRRGDFSLEPTAWWHKYPIEWRIRVPSLQLDLKCKAVLPDQELRGENGGPAYWEGAVDYSGSQKGVGYLEMTGYDRPVRF